MILIDQQLHGYRHGHQLLAATVKLPKHDQDTVDRLSDIAGPLRPSERFPPYLSFYPLPSGLWYVLARTWQDLDAPRAGCVRTRSLVIPAQEWGGCNVATFVALLSEQGERGAVEKVSIANNNDTVMLPHVDKSQCVELIEALFLEERKPVVVFDATDPEGIAVRLLSAIWPAFRRNISISTFALSPRTIGGHSFDLVFSPKDARSRFSGWEGRRIDAKRPTSSRHKWTNELIKRVFEGDKPFLFGDDIFGMLSSESDGTEADLRILLLWNELYDKLESSPSAVLGLLDIANSRKSRGASAIAQIEPWLAASAQQAVDTLPSPDAWQFLIALAKKLEGMQLNPVVVGGIKRATEELSSASPKHAFNNIKILTNTGYGRELLGSIGDGLARKINGTAQADVVALDPPDALTMVLASQMFAAATIPHNHDLSERLAIAIVSASKEDRAKAKELLPLLDGDDCSSLAEIIIGTLDRSELADEIALLAKNNGLSSDKLRAAVSSRAIEIGASREMREVIVTFPADNHFDDLLMRLLTPAAVDIEWLVNTPNLAVQRRIELISHLLVSSPSLPQLIRELNYSIIESIFELLLLEPETNIDLFINMLNEECIDTMLAVKAIVKLLTYSRREQALKLALRGLEIVMKNNIGTNQKEVLDELLETLGGDLDGAWLARLSLRHDIPGGIVAENMAALNRASAAVRNRLMLAIEDLAHSIVQRGVIDYPSQASEDVAEILWDSFASHPRAALKASATLMPFLLGSERESASALISAAFPIVYNELKTDSVAPEILRFFRFIDWDKCKTARRELVQALMRSDWRATDIALAAARAEDAERILRQIEKQVGGTFVLEDIRANLSRIPEPWQRQVRSALVAVHKIGGVYFDEVTQNEFYQVEGNLPIHVQIMGLLEQIGGGGYEGIRYKERVLKKAGWTTGDSESYAKNVEKATDVFNRIRNVLERTTDPDEIMRSL
jgi:hypothetical protein